MNSQFGATANIIKNEIKRKFDFFENFKTKDTTISKLNSFANLCKKAALEIKKYNPQIILIYGDRGETLITSFIAVNFNIPIAHFQGGDLSGNIDDIFRHSISKMSNYHFVSNQESKKNLIKLGEQKQNIFNVGELHIDTIKKIKFISWNKIKTISNLMKKQNLLSFTIILKLILM